MEIKKTFNNFYEGKRVFVTGHTGFKGSWLCFWLSKLGAEVMGYSLPPSTNPNHFELLRLDMNSVLADIRDRGKLTNAIREFNPEIVFHMAAQSLVRYSYHDPVETFETNIIGTVNALEACRTSENIKAAVIVTSDKCYENRDWFWGYRENDALGGYDPYSASKGCAELVTSAYRHSFFNPDTYGITHNMLLASVRAGNVIGGGDWAEDRLIPDIMKASSKNEKVFIRNPYAVRPWQHVLEALSGYLMLGQRLCEGRKEFAEGWNFGPREDAFVNVINVAVNCKTHWEKIDYKIKEDADIRHESSCLKLDCSKAHAKLNWKPIWDLGRTVSETVVWYKKFYNDREIITGDNLDEYIKCATKAGAVWI